MVLRSHSRAGRSEVISAEIQYEKPDCAPKPELEIVQPEAEFTPVAGSSLERGTTVTTGSPAIDSSAETVEAPSEGPFPDCHIQQTPIFTGTMAQITFFTCIQLASFLSIRSAPAAQRNVNQPPRTYV